MNHRTIHIPMAFILFCVFTHAGWASEGERGGGRDGGGGDAETSTVEQVKHAVNTGKLRLDAALENLKDTGDFKIRDARANTIFKKILLTIDTHKTLTDDARLQLREKENCVDEGNSNHMGSAAIGDPTSPICLSIPALRKIPPYELGAQIPPLLAHELAHQAGFQETDARYFQYYILKSTRNGAARAALIEVSSLAESSISQALQLLAKNAEKSKVCVTVGAAHAYLNSLSRLGSAAFPVDSLAVSEEDKALIRFRRKILEITRGRSITGYCGPSVPGVADRELPNFIASAIGKPVIDVPILADDRAELMTLLNSYLAASYAISADLITHGWGMEFRSRRK